MTDIPAAVAAGDLSFLDGDELQQWIVAQRWFGSKSRDVSQIDIAEVVPLRTEAPMLVLARAAVLGVSYFVLFGVIVVGLLIAAVLVR